MCNNERGEFRCERDVHGDRDRLWSGMLFERLKQVFDRLERREQGAVTRGHLLAALKGEQDLSLMIEAAGLGPSFSLLLLQLDMNKDVGITWDDFRCALGLELHAGECKQTGALLQEEDLGPDGQASAKLGTAGVLEACERGAQAHLDRTTLWIKTRWLMFFLSLAVYVVRAYLMRGYYVVSYCLGIYLLHLVIGFVSPAEDPEVDGGLLPTSEKGEFRPFVRRLPEFKFWWLAVRGTLFAFGMTFFKVFDVPVHWPFLLGYFVFLVVNAVRDRLKHMAKHKYIPMSCGKRTYSGLAGGVAPPGHVPETL